MYDTDSIQTYNWGHCQQFNKTSHCFVAWQDYRRFSLPPLPSFLIALLDTHGFLFTFLQVATKLTGKILTISLPKGFYSPYFITVFLGSFMLCFDINMQNQIENKANISKIIRYARGLFLTWIRKLRMAHMLCVQWARFCANRYLATF